LSSLVDKVLSIQKVLCKTSCVSVLLAKELASAGHVSVLLAMMGFCREAWKAKHAWLLNIVRGVHFDMWDFVVSRQHWTLAFFAFPVQAEPKVNLSPRCCKYRVSGCGGGRLCNCRSSNCLSLGLQLGCCCGSNAGVEERVLKVLRLVL